MKVSISSDAASTGAAKDDCRNQRNRGFTLIELVIVVAIVAILALIALPSYQQQMMKARRSQAKADLTELAQQMERYYTINRTYVGFDLATSGITQSPRDGNPVVAYTLDFGAAPAVTTYQLRMTPAAGSPQAQDRCGILTLDNAGRKTHSIGDNGLCDWGITP